MVLAAFALAFALIGARTDGTARAGFLGFMTITSIDSNYGPTSGGTYAGGANATVTIRGTGFRNTATGVTFDGVRANNFRAIDDTTIVATPPPHSTAEPVTVLVEGGLFAQPCLFPLPCLNGYYYMLEIPFNVAYQGVIIPTTSVSVGPGSLELKMEALDAPITLNGYFRTSVWGGIPIAWEVSANATIPRLETSLTLSLEGDTSFDFLWPVPNGGILIPGVLTLRFHLEASAGASFGITQTIAGFSGSAKASFINWIPNFQMSAKCNGRNVSFTNFGDCVYADPSLTGSANAKISPLYLALGMKDVANLGFNASAGFSLVRLGVAGGAAVPGGVFGDLCLDAVHLKMAAKIPNFWGGKAWEFATEGRLFGPVSLLEYPAGSEVARENCALGPAIGWTNNGTVVSSDWGNSETPPPPPPPGAATDSTPPDISVVVTPPSNPFGWNSAPVSVTWTVSDPESGIVFTNGCMDTQISDETAGTLLTCQATNGAGLSTFLSTRLVRIDKTAPTTTHTLQPAAPNGKRGWYVSDVTVTLNPSDPLLTSGEAGSGIQYTKYRVNDGAWQDYSTPFVVSTESLENKVEYYSVDNADNTEATKSFTFKLDKTKPEIGITTGETDDITWDQARLQRGILSNDANLALTGTATDNLCLWEVRAVDADTGATLASQAPVGAGVYPPPPPTSLTYSLNVPLHTGINTIDLTAEDCAGWEKAVRTQVVYVVPGPYDTRGKGFWYNAVKTGKYSPSQFARLLTYINVASDVWGNDSTRNRYGALTNTKAIDLLNYSETNPDMEYKMEGHLLAQWLDMVSGRLAVKKGVNVSRVAGWPIVMDDIGGNPQTFAYKVALEIEEKVQPFKRAFAINSVSKDLAEGTGSGALETP